MTHSLKRYLFKKLKPALRILLSLSVIASILGNVPVRAADDISYDIVFNPTGTHFRDAVFKDDNGQLVIRLDFYPTEGTKAYDHHHVYVPVIPPDYNGDPELLPHEWRINPALCLFVEIDFQTTVDDLQSYIDRTFTPEMLYAIDDLVVRNNAGHYISPLLRNQAAVSSGVTIGNKQAIISDINDRFDGYFVSNELNLNRLLALPESIDVGSDATDRANYLTVYGNTQIDTSNPANGDGTIDTVQVYLYSQGYQVTFGTFYNIGGSDYKCRDSEYVGSVSSGSMQTFTPLDIDISTGDHIGFRDAAQQAKIEAEYSGGSGYYYYAGEAIDPGDEATYTLAGSYPISLYGTGESGLSAPTVTSDNSTNVKETTATLSGNITDTGGENADERGFNFGTSPGVYTDNQTESGNFTAGIYSLGVTGLPPGDEIYWCAIAHNSGGWGSGEELYLETKPQPPTGLNDTSQTDTSIEYEWTHGAGGENVTLRYRTDGTYPADYNDGTLGYNGTASSCNITGLSPGQEVKARIWEISTDNTTIYSDGYAELTAYTLPGDPSNLSLSNPTSTTIDAEWTSGAGGDKSMVRWKTGGYPADETDGTQGYFGTSNSTTIPGLPPETRIYVAVWNYDSDSGHYSAGSAQASENTTESVGVYPPDDFDSEQIAINSVNLTWSLGSGSTAVIIRVSTESFPESLTDGYLVYSGNGTVVTHEGLELGKTTYFYSGWGTNGVEYSAQYAITSIGGGIGMNTEQFWILIMVMLSLGLLIVNFFRFNILIVIAAIFVNIGITQLPGIEKWLYYAAIFLAVAEAATGFVRMVWGRKNKKRYVG